MHLGLLAQLVLQELLVLPGQLGLQATLELLALLARLVRLVLPVQQVIQALLAQ